MSLYIKPPSGTISLKTLECFIINRLNFLTKIVEVKTTDSTILQSIVNDSVYQSQCLISGTQKDSISHFALRLILSKDDETSTFLLEAEKVLFKFRCWCMTEDELYRFLKTFNKFTNYIIPGFQNLDNLSVALKSLLELKKQCQNSWRILAFRYFNHDGSFQVPFQTVLPLVHKRLMIIKNGIAFVPYSQLPVFLTELFSLFLDTGIKQARTQDNDERLKYISEIILRRCRIFLKRKTRSRSELYLPGLYLNKHSIDEHSRVFPPCMLNLHQTLRDRHRLNHHARIQYSLFLKEIGLGVDDAIEFWREEYSRPASPDTDWGTDWKRAASRYIYNIRHLYGLEGSCKNYTGHCCQSIQNQIMKPTDAGGCPFVHFDPKHFKNFLYNQNLSDSDSKHLVSLRNCGKYNEACGYYRDRVLLKSFSEENNVYQKTSRQQDGGGGMSLNCDRTYLDNLKVSNDRVDQLERDLNIDDERTVTERRKLDQKEILFIKDHSERRNPNINGNNELKTMSEKFNLVLIESPERRYINIDEEKEWKISSEKHKTVHSDSRYLDIDGQKITPKRKLIGKETTVLTESKKVCISRNEYKIVFPEITGLTNEQVSDDDEDYFGCDHSDCPSQGDPRQDGELSMTSVIEKPLDYCLSYQTLLHKLHTLS